MAVLGRGSPYFHLWHFSEHMNPKCFSPRIKSLPEVFPFFPIALQMSSTGFAGNHGEQVCPHVVRVGCLKLMPNMGLVVLFVRSWHSEAFFCSDTCDVRHFELPFLASASFKGSGISPPKRSWIFFIWSSSGRGSVSAMFLPYFFNAQDPSAISWSMGCPYPWVPNS